MIAASATLHSVCRHRFVSVYLVEYIPIYFSMTLNIAYHWVLSFFLEQLVNPGVVAFVEMSISDHSFLAFITVTTTLPIHRRKAGHYWGLPESNTNSRSENDLLG